MGVLKTLVKNSEINKESKTLSKSELRKVILKKRDELSPEEHRELSEVIAGKIFNWDVYKESESILVYVSFRSEINTYDIIKNALNEGKKVYCPKINEDDMFFYQINSLNDLMPGYMGIMEPKEGLTALKDTACKTLVLMPGSVFDKKGNRVGYGKGYYDRFLSDCRKKGLNFITSALAFSFQIVENIPAEQHDYKADYIFTEKEIFGL